MFWFFNPGKRTTAILCSVKKRVRQTHFHQRVCPELLLLSLLVSRWGLGNHADLVNNPLGDTVKIRNVDHLVFPVWCVLWFLLWVLWFISESQSYTSIFGVISKIKKLLRRKRMKVGIFFLCSSILNKSNKPMILKYCVCSLASVCSFSQTFLIWPPLLGKSQLSLNLVNLTVLNEVFFSSTNYRVF